MWYSGTDTKTNILYIFNELAPKYISSLTKYKVYICILYKKYFQKRKMLVGIKLGHIYVKYVISNV